VRVERRWWRAQRLLPGERYLSDIAREIGRDRFQRFWTSSLPVDAALAAALKQPVGDWTEQWERRFIARIRLGAAAPLGATALALLLATIALATVTLTASRRQVR
jgi:AcrR family transcriptional regulator